ncbi:hypothetical protein [Neomegalonema sp.]|uniref:hypothetical protein n=1 Tax=Neomegalonema sp. TaxID=2039713 RepID=UPI0026215027|nr:hypothetical protein [Neomegalonema sp.]MDD2867740.1 hypothetical protein [Neomegalonema sp.]
MTRRSWRSAAACCGLIGLGFPSEAWPCRLTGVEFSTSEHSLRSEYDARAATDARIFMTPQFDAEDAACLRIPLTIEPERTGGRLLRDGGEGFLNFRILQDDAAARNGPVMEIIRNQFSLAGDYRANFRVFPSGEPAAAVQGELRVNAIPITHFVHGAFSTSIDFGEIGDGLLRPRLDKSILEKTVDFIYQANIPTRVSLRSAKGGYLRLERQPDLTPIAYGVQINNVPLELDPAAAKVLNMEFGQHKTGKITILLKDAQGLAAGSYSDQLTVTFTPDE